MVSRITSDVVAESSSPHEPCPVHSSSWRLDDETNEKLNVFALKNRYQKYWQKHLEPARRPVLLITILAVHRPSLCRLERDLCLSSAVRTFHGVHFPWAGTETAIVSAWSVVNEDYLLLYLIDPSRGLMVPLLCGLLIYNGVPCSSIPVDPFARCSGQRRIKGNDIPAAP